MKKGDRVRVAGQTGCGGVYYVNGVVAGPPANDGRISVRLQSGDGSSAAASRLGRPVKVYLPGFGEAKRHTGGTDRWLYGRKYIA